jgi:hypothetical protein
VHLILGGLGEVFFIGKMPGKAKTQKHTAKELKGKEFAATVNRGGGSAGVSDRKV